MRLMGVSTRIGIMRCFVVVLAWAWARGSAVSCPSLCSCRGAASEPAPGEPLRLRCGPEPAQITELKEIDFTGIAGSVVSLNISGNVISTLSRDLHLPNLQKLDLSRNQINLIESDAFYNITSVQRLDLSHNQISSVYREMFKGLVSLERLLLAHNLISELPEGTFDYLIALKQLDIAENRLVCSCALVWLGAWQRASGARLAGSPRCALPESLAGRPVRKLRLLLAPAACGAAAPDALQLRPARDQLVFEGDSLALSCAAPFASSLHEFQLRWSHPSVDECGVNVTAADLLDDGSAETVALLANVTARHAGAWTCEYSDASRLRRNATVGVVVVGNSSRYCPTEVTRDNRGLLSWPQLLLNRTAAVPCRAGDARATRHCGAAGAWGPADTAACAYVSNVTKLLQQFALLDVGLVQYSALNASARLAALLREKTYPLAEVDDPDDVMFVARAVRNYMRHLPEEKDLGSALLDVISAAMDVPPRVMAAAEARYGSCTQLVRAAERLALTHQDKQKANLAVESFPLRPGFGGATCVWYGAGAAPRLHCSGTNRTVARLLALADEPVHASVQVPASLQPLARPSGAALVLGVFRDAALFPLLPRDETPDAHRAKDYYGRSTKREDLDLEIASPVVSVQLHNGSLSGALLEPIVVTLRADDCGSARAVVWDPATARWQYNTSECVLLGAAGAAACALSLSGAGACALAARAERGVWGARAAGARYKASHPAVYVGSLLLLGCLAALLATYAAAFPALAAPRRAKHALLNTWLALAALCLLYALGVYQTEERRLCRALGLLLHYLSLCVLVWMCVSAHVLLRGLAPAPAEPAPARPVLGLYLAGWGVALVVCGISAAVNLREYAGHSQCFLSSAPALGALFVPAGALLLYLAALLLLARRRLASEPEGPEPAPALPAGRGDEDAEDAERAPAVRLRAQAVVLGLYLAAWGCGAVAVYRPLPAYLPYQEDICSICYAVAATVLGTFVLFFYGIARSDVRAQWALMRCYLRRGKPCCRDRSVFDSARPGALLPAPGLPGLPDRRERSGSRSSSRTASKNNGSYRAAELNTHTLPKDALKNTNAESPNINLVVLHRRQYRSDNSVLTCPDECEAFYNPNQMNVAKKFFRKQRQNVKRNRLELPARRDFDEESRASLPLPRVADILVAGSKVNNTNLHVERGAGLKETRHALDPNLLEQPEEHKTYSADRRSWGADEPKPRRAPVVNIYTNVPETAVPQHQVAAREPDTRTVSQQCSLEYSSSEPAPSASDHTLDTHSELTSPHEPGAPCEPCEATETTDTESFGLYVDCRPPGDRDRELLRDISEECTVSGDTARDAPGAGNKDGDFETSSTNASEQGFENESDIYCPNYQMSEVSIRSHGLYAPSPASMCPNELGFSAEDVSRVESQYANLAAPGRDSPASGASDLDELYTRIAGRDPALDLTASSDVTLRPDSPDPDPDPDPDPGPGPGPGPEPRAETAV